MPLRSLVRSPHPARGVLAMRRISIRHIAQRLGLHPITVGRMLLGQQRATPRFRVGLAVLLRLPESALFRDDDRPAPARRGRNCGLSGHYRTTCRSSRGAA
jgi:hypothetical protein